MMYRKRRLVPINHVNPIYINDLEQSHRVVGSLFWPMPNGWQFWPMPNGWQFWPMPNGWQLAIATNHDLL
jgi:hypothetical protein